MNILITGAHGQVGSECVARGGIGLARAKLDLSQRTSVHQTLARLRPRAVINTAAYTAVDKAETDSSAAYMANRDGVAHLADACRDLDIPLIHLSTDYVFDGDKPGAYTEDDTPAPAGIYARSKWEGEQALRSAWSKHLILRVSWVFGAHGNNFVKTILRLARERPELRVIADQRGCPTHAGAIAEAAVALAGRAAQGEALPWGTYHYCGTPVTTWHGFATQIVETAHALNMIASKPPVRPISTAEYPLPAKRPANSVLDTSRAQSRLGLIPRDWREGLRETLHTLKETST